MTSHLLITPQTRSAQLRRRSRSLWQSGHLGLRWVRYQCSPWLVLAIAPLQLLFAAETERTRAQIRYFSAIARINFVRVYELLNELIW